MSQPLSYGLAAPAEAPAAAFPAALPRRVGVSSDAIVGVASPAGRPPRPQPSNAALTLVADAPPKLAEAGLSAPEASSEGPSAHLLTVSAETARSLSAGLEWSSSPRPTKVRSLALPRLRVTGSAGPSSIQSPSTRSVGSSASFHSLRGEGAFGRRNEGRDEDDPPPGDFASWVPWERAEGASEAANAARACLTQLIHATRPLHVSPVANTEYVRPVIESSYEVNDCVRTGSPTVAACSVLPVACSVDGSPQVDGGPTLDDVASAMKVLLGHPESRPICENSKQKRGTNEVSSNEVPGKCENSFKFGMNPECEVNSARGALESSTVEVQLSCENQSPRRPMVPPALDDTVFGSLAEDGNSLATSSPHNVCSSPSHNFKVSFNELVKVVEVQGAAGNPEPSEDRIIEPQPGWNEDDLRGTDNATLAEAGTSLHPDTEEQGDADVKYAQDRIGNVTQEAACILESVRDGMPDNMGDSQVPIDYSAVDEHDAAQDGIGDVAQEAVCILACVRDGMSDIMGGSQVPIVDSAVDENDAAHDGIGDVTQEAARILEYVKDGMSDSMGDSQVLIDDSAVDEHEAMPCGDFLTNTEFDRSAYRLELHVLEAAASMMTVTIKDPDVASAVTEGTRSSEGDVSRVVASPTSAFAAGAHNPLHLDFGKIELKQETVAMDHAVASEKASGRSVPVSNRRSRPSNKRKVEQNERSSEADALLNQLKRYCKPCNMDALERWCERQRFARPKQRPGPQLPPSLWRAEPTSEDIHARNLRRKERLERHLAEKEAMALRSMQGIWQPADEEGLPTIKMGRIPNPALAELLRMRKAQRRLQCGNPPSNMQGNLLPSELDRASSASAGQVEPDIADSIATGGLPKLAVIPHAQGAKSPIGISRSTPNLPRFGDKVDSVQSSLPSATAKDRNIKPSPLGQIRAVVAPYAPAFQVGGMRHKRKPPVLRNPSLPAIGKPVADRGAHDVFARVGQAVCESEVLA